MTITIALTVLKPYQKRALCLDLERTREWIVDDLVQRIMGKPESEAVILRPDMLGVHSERVGRWGEDEPHPFPDLPESG